MIARITSLTMLLSLVTVTNAQFGGLKKSIGLGKKETPNMTTEQFGASFGGLLNDVAKARVAFLSAQEQISEALGLKAEAAACRSEAKRLGEGVASKSGGGVDSLKSSVKISQSANQAIVKKLSDGEPLSAESKKEFVKGTATFFKGVLLEKQQIEAIQGLVGQGQAMAKSASFLKKAKIVKMVKPVKDLVSLVPGDVKEGVATLKSISAFAKKQDIKLEQSDTKVDDLLGDL